MSMNILNDISKVYMEKVASKPDFLDLDNDGNKKEPMKKAAKEKDPFGRPGGKYGGVPKEGGGYDRGYKSMQKKLKELDKVKTESLDPVGQEDSDIDNDGDTDSSDKYLHKRRKAIGKAIKKEKMKESFSNWRQDLSEVMDDIEANKQIKEKKVNNKIKINPEIKEAVEELGGELIEMVELDEKAYRGLGVGRVERVSSGSYKAPETTGSAAKRKPKTETKPVETKKPAALPPEQGRRAKKRRAGSPSYAEVKAQIDAKEKSRKPKRSKRSRLDSLLASIRNEETQLDEKTLTSAETKEKERIVKSMKDKASDFEKRYPGRGKEVMYATATKIAKKVDEAVVGGSAPNLPAKVVKFVDELPQNLQKTFTKIKPSPIKSSPSKIQSSSPSKIQSGPKITQEELEVIDERRRGDKGTPRPAEPSAAFKAVSKMMRQQTGKPAGQRKKVPGKKPPKAGEFGAPQSPEQKVKIRRAQKQRSQEWQQDTKGT